MPTVVAVKLRNYPKILWFDPVLGNYKENDYVIVETERGREIGLVIDSALDVTEQQIEELKSPLKPVIRVLTDLDYDYVDQLEAKGRESMTLFRELIEKHGLDMKPIEVEYLFNGDRAVFYFSSDERIDFRELVRELASGLHIRVDMRQIGVRDEARMLGGLAHCGEEFCCTRMGGEFKPVSIRMAKEQDLPLNPVKISGACGRLMCCLRYEFEAYKDFKTRAPKKGTKVDTPLGVARINDLNTPREALQIRFENGKEMLVPLKDLECSKDVDSSEGTYIITRETIEAHADSSILIALGALDREKDLAQSSLADAPAEYRPALRPRRRSKGDSTKASTEPTTIVREAADKTEPRKPKSRLGKRLSGLRGANRSEAPESSEPRQQEGSKEQPRDTSQKNQPGQSRSAKRRSQQSQQRQKEQLANRKNQPERQGQAEKSLRPNSSEGIASPSIGGAVSSGLGGGRKKRRRRNKEGSESSGS